METVSKNVPKYNWANAISQLYKLSTYLKIGGNLRRFLTDGLFNPGKSSAKFQKCSGKFYWWYCTGVQLYTSPNVYDYGFVMYLNRSDESP